MAIDLSIAIGSFQHRYGITLGMIKINTFAVLVLMLFAYSNVQAISNITLKSGSPTIYRGLGNLAWEEARINYGEIFIVFAAIANGRAVIKPASFKYNLHEYETLFGFGPYCKGFDSQKIIDITSMIQDYSYQEDQDDQ